MSHSDHRIPQFIGHMGRDLGLIVSKAKPGERIVCLFYFERYFLRVIALLRDFEPTTVCATIQANNSCILFLHLQVSQR